jgi:hypothetical protein
MRARPGRRRKVVTTAPTGLQAVQKAPQDEQPSIPYVNQEDVRDPRKALAYQEACKPGAMWFTVKDLVRVESDDLTHEGMRHLKGRSRYSDENIVVRKGTMCIYAGTVQEKARKGKGFVTATKHCFVVGTGRWIVRKLSLLKPVELA